MSPRRLGRPPGLIPSGLIPAPSGLIPALAVVAVACGGGGAAGSWGPARYPASRVEDVTETKFATLVHDPYRWLENAGSDEVVRWMAAQDRLAGATLAALPARERFARRFDQLLRYDATFLPAHHGTRWFYWKSRHDQDKRILCWREGPDGDGDGPEHVLLDPNTMSADGSVSVSDAVASWDGTRVAFVRHENGADAGAIHVIDVATGRMSAEDVVPEADYSTPSWTPEGDGFYYVRFPYDVPAADRVGAAVPRFHRLGTPAARDPTVHEVTGDASVFPTIALSRDGHWLIYSTWRGSETDVWFRDARRVDAPWRPLTVGRKAQTQVTVWKDRFYILSFDGAPKGRVAAADPAHPAFEQWRTLVPERPDRVLAEVRVVGGRLVVSSLIDGADGIEIHDLDGKPVRDVELPGLGEVAGLSGMPDEDELYYQFSSYTTPLEIYRTSVTRGGAARESHVELPVDPGLLTVERQFVVSRDGTRVPMFLVHRKDAPRDGSTPWVLEGYGGFDVTFRPAWSATVYSWVEAGGGYAWVSLRGDGTYGEDWHEAGMLARKQNGFDDFIAAAEHLIAERRTSPTRLGILGGSNGGLLMGAVTVQRPELFRAVVCQVPLLDMVRYHRFGLGQNWIAEYGSADEDEAQFRALFAYSPYHHVRPGTAYPSLLFMSADSDDRVDPFHARKMAAALQAASRGGRPVLLRIRRHAGHLGADLIRETVASESEIYAFFAAELGLGTTR
jgi:prolyl oligopeptidase